MSVPQHWAEVGVFPLLATMRFPPAEPSGLELLSPSSLAMACIPRWAVRHPLDLHALHVTPLSVCEAVGRAGTGGDSNMSYIVPLDACSPVLAAGGAHGLVSP